MGWTYNTTIGITHIPSIVTEPLYSIWDMVMVMVYRIWWTYNAKIGITHIPSIVTAPLYGIWDMVETLLITL